MSNYYMQMFTLYSLIRDLQILEDFNTERELEIEEEYRSGRNEALDEYAQSPF